MKKKILILSLVVNLIAGAFVLYAFTTPKAKNVNEGGSGYVTMRVVEGTTGANELSVTDGINIIGQEDLQNSIKPEKMRINSQLITKKMNELKSQGYELISSNACGGGGYANFTNYIFLKK